MSHCKVISLVFICDTLLGCSESFILLSSSFKRLRKDSFRFHLYVCMCECVCSSVIETANVKLNLIGSIKKCRGSAAGKLPAARLTAWPGPLEYNFHNLIIQQRVLNSEMIRAELKSGSSATGIYLTLTMRVQSYHLLVLSQTCMTCFKNHTSLHFLCAYLLFIWSYLSEQNSITQQMKGYMELCASR